MKPMNKTMSCKTARQKSNKTMWRGPQIICNRERESRRDEEQRVDTTTSHWVAAARERCLDTTAGRQLAQDSDRRVAATGDGESLPWEAARRLARKKWSEMKNEETKQRSASDRTKSNGREEMTWKIRRTKKRLLKDTEITAWHIAFLKKGIHSPINYPYIAKKYIIFSLHALSRNDIWNGWKE